MPTEAQIRQAEIMKKARAQKVADIPAALEQEQEQAEEVNNNVEIEVIGPEPDIFDKVVNNPNYSPERPQYHGGS